MALTKEDLKSIEEVTERVSRRVSEEVSRKVAEEVFAKRIDEHIDNFAILVNKSFQGVQDQLNDIKEVVDNHTDQLTEVNQRLDRMEHWQNGQQKMLDSHDRRIEILEKVQVNKIAFASI